MPHLILLALLALAPLASAQELRLLPRRVPEQRLDLALTPGHDPRAIVLKLVDDAGGRAVDGGLLASAGGRDLAVARRVLDGIPGASLEPLFDAPASELQRLRRLGESRRRRALADLSQYFLLRLPSGVDATAVVTALLAPDEVEHAYVATHAPPPPGDYSPATPALQSSQTYRSAAPSGIDALYAQGQPGGTGAGIAVADVEYAWNLSGLFGNVLGHEDLQTASNGAPAIGSAASWVNPFPDTHHGTAVAGILCADSDAPGITGLAPGATLRVSACAWTSGLNIARAIVRALRGLAQGEVMLIEMQNFGPNFSGSGQFGMVPVEWYGAEYGAIALATALGVHVVEAAGNGSQDLDSTAAPNGDPSYAQEFNLAITDSGAVLVGAGSSSTPHALLSFSNVGKRLDAYAWGQNVVTLGYGDLFNGNPASPDVDQYYTSGFAGTSSASAIVASAAVSLAASHWARFGLPYEPYALRLLLRTTGTPSSSPTSDRIGRQPDLKDQMQVLAMGPEPGVVFSGEASGDQAGRSVAAAGDVDDDGVPDVIVGAYLNSAGGGNAGRAYVVSGLTGAVVRTFTGQAIGDQFGWSVAGAGDVNNDGWDDVVVGARWNAAGGTNAGRVYVLSGQSGAALYTFTGQTGFELGFSVDGAGDVNGDGRPDIVAGALGANAGVGRAYVYSGATGALLWTLNGTATLGHFGYSVAGAGDVDGDGKADVIVGAPHSGGSGGPMGLQIGNAYVYSGASGALVRSWQGGVNYAQFGAAVDGAGDFDGDGRADVIVGSPYFDAGSTDIGRADVFSGNTSLVLRTWLGQAYDDRFGESVAGAGDFDGDGKSDVIVGAPSHDANGSDAGRAYVFAGGTGATIATYDGQAASNLFGSAVASAGDVDGDGIPELIVGAKWHAVGQNGRAYVFFGQPKTPFYLGFWH